jgi:hypothetical protein
LRVEVLWEAMHGVHAGCLLARVCCAAPGVQLAPGPMLFGGHWQACGPCNKHPLNQVCYVCSAARGRLCVGVCGLTAVVCGQAPVCTCAPPAAACRGWCHRLAALCGWGGVPCEHAHAGGERASLLPAARTAFVTIRVMGCADAALHCVGVG